MKAKDMQGEKAIKLEKQIQKVAIDKRTLAELSNSEDVYLKIDSFIRERLPVSDIFFEFSLDVEHEELTQEEAIKEFFDMFYSAVVTEDMDLFLSVISSESVKEIWDKEIDIDKRIASMQNVITTINGGGTLETMHYQFKKVEPEQLSTSGMLYLQYSDGNEVSVPFELMSREIEAYHDGHTEDKFFTLKNVLDINKAIEEL